MEITWKRIFDKYVLSSDGRVISESQSKRSTTKELKPYLMNNGYLHYKLCVAGKVQNWLAHRLVATYFIGDNNSGYIVNHIDGNKTNNHYSNLEWISQRENVCHSNKNKNKTSKYVGVYWYKARKRWRSNINVNGKYIDLGLHKSEEDAYNARINAEKKHSILNKYI